MRVIPGIEITDSRLTSSTVPEEVAATYNAGTPYNEGDLAGAAPVYGSPQTVWRGLQVSNTGNTQVEGVWWENAGTVYMPYNSGSSCGIGGIVTDLATHSLYESLVVSNTGNALTDTASWKYIGKTNRYRMFDYYRNQKTSVPKSITIVIAPGKRFNTISLRGMVATAYDLSVTSVYGGGVIKSESGSLSARNTTTWSEHYWGEFGNKPSLIYLDVPPYSDNIVTLTLTVGSGNVEIESFLVGTYVYLGQIQRASDDDVLNFSQIDRDEDGNSILTPRKNVPNLRQTVFCAKSNVNKARKVREDLNAVPALWLGIDDPTDGYFESLSTLGVYKRFKINDELPLEAVINFEFEGV